MGKEITLYNYLNREEADELIGNLFSNGIDAITKGMNTDGVDLFHVIIDQSDLELASQVAEAFRMKLNLKRERLLYACSRCHSKLSIVLDRKKFPWWRKFMTQGLIVIQCSNCKYVWYA